MKIALNNIIPADETEKFKFQILVDHLKLKDALLIANSYSNNKCPYSDTVALLTEQCGQPHKLDLQRIAEVLDAPTIRNGDVKSFRMFALRVKSLVGMLEELGEDGSMELKCGSHVTRLLAKLPHNMQANFKRYINPLAKPIPYLLDLSAWLKYEVPSIHFRLSVYQHHHSFS